MPSAVQKELDRLYGVPLAEFTETRNEIVAALSAIGEGDAAAEVKALKKPSVIAWTVNQLSRRHAGEVRRLLEAGERLRKAHRKAVSSARAENLREVAQGERAVIRELLAKAETIMKEAGGSATRSHLGAVEETLSAAAVDQDARELLQQGRLTKQMQRAGFGDVSGLTVIAGGRGRAEPAAEETEEDEAARARTRELERTARHAARDADRLERVADTAAEKLERLRVRIAEAESEADTAAQAASEARKAAGAARREADDAGR